MTRKEYKLISDAISGQVGLVWDISQRRTIQLVAQAIADALQDDNPHFNRPRFMKECGL